MDTALGVEFKWLDGDELDQLEPIIRARGWVPLNKKMARAYAAFAGDEIVGFACFNCIPHVEPLYVDRTYRGTGLAKDLTDALVDFLYAVECPAAYILADNPASEALAKAHGMERVDVPVYRKLR